MGGTSAGLFYQGTGDLRGRYSGIMGSDSMVRWSCWWYGLYEDDSSGRVGVMRLYEDDWNIFCGWYGLDEDDWVVVIVQFEYKLKLFENSIVRERDSMIAN